LLYISTQIRSCVTCYASKRNHILWPTKLKNSLEKPQPELSTRTCMMKKFTLKLRQLCVPAGVKHIILLALCSSFELEDITKHLMTGLTRNSEFCFPSTSGNTGGLGEIKLTVSLGASRKMLLMFSALTFMASLLNFVGHDCHKSGWLLNEKRPRPLHDTILGIK